MTAKQIRFEDGAAYERYMGKWSRLLGEDFLAWLAPRKGLRWLDVGCGNGAFTELIAERCAPQSVQGVDPSEAQLRFARERAIAGSVAFSQGDAMALQFADATFDAAVMPLVVAFVPEPARGVAEMVRVVEPGGLVAAYMWDFEGGGFPYETLHQEVSGIGIDPLLPPSPWAARLDAMQTLWSEAGLQDVEARQFTVQRTYADFEDYWTTVLGAPSVSAKLSALAPSDAEWLRGRLRGRLETSTGGPIVCSARANAIKGRVAAPR